MTFRKWVVRGFVLTLLVGAGTGYYLFQRWTNPEAVRAAVMDELSRRLPGAAIRLDGARLRLLGGIQLSDLHLSRRDDPGAPPFFAAPSIILTHDKEQLSRGTLVIRKIEVKRPQITLIRHADGTWNVEGLVAATAGDSPAGPLPFVEMHHGTLSFIDHTVETAPLEVTDLELTLSPGSADCYQVQLRGRSEVAGPFQLQGRINGTTGEAVLAVEVPEVRLGPALVDRVADYLPKARTHAAGVEGRVHLRANAAYHPRAAQPLSYDAAAEITGLRVAHPSLPFPVADGHASLRLAGERLTLERFSGKIGGGSLTASGELAALDADADFHLQATIDALTLSPSTYDRLPPDMTKICREFSPEGTFSFAGDYRRKGGRLGIRQTIRPQAMRMSYDELPYPVADLHGVLTQDVDATTGESLLAVDLTGKAGGVPVRIAGRVHGEGSTAGLELDLSAEQFPIDEHLIAALSHFPHTQKTVLEFRPRGRVSFLAQLRSRQGIRSKSGTRLPENRFVLTIHQSSICFDDFRYPVEEVDGTLELLPDDTWRFTDVTASHKGGTFRATGHSRHTPDGERLELAIAGTNVLLDAEMRAALPEAKLRDAWDNFAPSGRVDVNARVTRVKGNRPDLALDVAARNVGLKPASFPYALANATGRFHFHRNRLTIENLRARHGETTVTLKNADVILRRGDGFWADLRGLEFAPLPMDEDILAALPTRVRTAFATLRPDRPVRVVVDQLTVDRPDERWAKEDIYWDGYMVLADTAVHCGVDLKEVTGVAALRGRHNGRELVAQGNLQLQEATLFRQPFRDVKGRLELTDDWLKLYGIKAALHAGDVNGHVLLKFKPGGDDYEVDLHADHVDLEQLVRQGRAGNEPAQATGRAFARLFLTGNTDDPASLRGQGNLHIPNGRLYDLPLILDLLTFLSGRLPKGFAFEEAYTEFDVEGDRVALRQIDLLGDAISLSGQGELRTDFSDMNLEMYGLLWGRTLPLLPPLLDRIPTTVSKQLMKIRMRGPIGKVKVTTEPLPAVVEPLRRLWAKLNGRGMQER